MTHIKFKPGQSMTIEIPGMTAIRIDAERRMIAIDCISGRASEDGPRDPEWTVHDLREGTYGDFHRLRPAGECFDAPGCARRGQHDFEPADGDSPHPSPSA